MTDSIDDIIADIADEGEKLEKPPKDKRVVEPSADNIAKREALLKAAANGDIEKSAKSIEKLSPRGVEKLFAKLEASKHLRAQSFLSDMALSKFAKLMGGLNAVQDPEVLEKELREDPLLRNDMTRIVSYIEPYLPFVGLLSGGITVGTHVMSNKKGNDETKEE